MVSFHCGYCNNLNTLSTSKYQVRMNQSKSGLLYCSSRCSGDARKHLHNLRLKGIPFHNITTPLNKELVPFSRGVLANPEKRGGEEERSKEKIMGTVLDWIQNNPSVNLMALEIDVQDNGFFVKTSMGSPTLAPSVQAPVQVPVQQPSPQIDWSGGLDANMNLAIVTRLKGLSNPPADISTPTWKTWVGQLTLQEQRTIVGECDAIDFSYIDEAIQDWVSGKHCMWVPDFFSEVRKTYGRYLFAQRNRENNTLYINVDGYNGKEASCYRCQGQGAMTIANLAWNYKYDISTSIACDLCGGNHSPLNGTTWTDYIDAKFGIKQVLNNALDSAHGIIKPMILGKPGTNYQVNVSTRQVTQVNNSIVIPQVPQQVSPQPEPLPFSDIEDNPFPTS